MTSTGSSEVRRHRRLRALRVLWVQAPAEPGRPFADAEALAEARRAWREWGGLVAPLFDEPARRR